MFFLGKIKEIKKLVLSLKVAVQSEKIKWESSNYEPAIEQRY